MEKPKRRSRTCPNNQDHTMHRAFISQVRGGRRSWQATSWQYCPECRVMLPDQYEETDARAGKMAGVLQGGAIARAGDLFKLH